MRLRDPILMALIVIALGIAAAFLYGWWTQRVPPDPNAIVDAICDLGDYKGVSDEAVISAIMRYGDVNGFSPRDQCSFLYAAAEYNRSNIVSWLLDHSADPNLPGRSPLLACIRGGDGENARRLLTLGARWRAGDEHGKLEFEHTRQVQPELMEQLLREFPQ